MGWDQLRFMWISGYLKVSWTVRRKLSVNSCFVRFKRKNLIKMKKNYCMTILSFKLVYLSVTIFQWQNGYWFSDAFRIFCRFNVCSGVLFLQAYIRNSSYFPVPLNFGPSSSFSSLRRPGQLNTCNETIKCLKLF